MCIRVRFAPRRTLTDPWDADALIITLPRELHRPVYAMEALRVLLTKLGVEQPAGGAVCWCGEPITLPLIPMQRRSIDMNGQEQEQEARRRAS